MNKVQVLVNVGKFLLVPFEV